MVGTYFKWFLLLEGGDDGEEDLACSERAVLFFSYVRMNEYVQKALLEKKKGYLE